MRLTKSILLILALQLATGAVFAVPKQDMASHKGPRNSDENLKREVRHELVTVPWYSVFDIIKFEVNDNNVTLMGAVTNPTVKTDAETAVKHIEGVEKVTDQIEVLPPSPSDDQLRRAEYRAIYSQGTLSRYGLGSLQSIHIIVKSGHVTLEGNVDTEADKNAAGVYANGVSGVFSVTNNLIVTGGK